MNSDNVRSALAVQCLPMGMKDRGEVFAAVDAAIAAVDKSGLKYTVGPFETVIEGPLDQLLETAAAAHKALIAAGAPTAASYMKLWSGENIGSSEEKIGKYRAAGH